MKFIALDREFDYKTKTKGDVVHVLLFHGNAIRADAAIIRARPPRGPYSDCAHQIGDDLSHPLLLIRSGLYVPPIFLPSAPLVIREELYQRLYDFPGLVFVEAKPKKLIRLYKPIGDFSFYKSRDPIIRRNRHRPDELLDWMPNDPSLFPTFPKCYEMVPYNVHTYDGDEPHTIRVNFIMNNRMKDEVEWSGPSWIIDKYPLLWGGGVYFLRQDLFDLVEDAIDYDFFAVMPVDL